MSYDLTFIHRAPGQLWEEALAAAEAAADGEPTGRPDREAWERIVADANQLLGQVSTFEGPSYLELDHENTGIQISLYADEASVTVPYWYAGADATQIAAVIYQLGAIVEKHTALSGYDGQVGAALADAAARPEQAVAVFDQVAASFAQRGVGNPG